LAELEAGNSYSKKKNNKEERREKKEKDVTSSSATEAESIKTHGWRTSGGGRGGEMWECQPVKKAAKLLGNREGTAEGVKKGNRQKGGEHGGARGRK